MGPEDIFARQKKAKILFKPSVGINFSACDEVPNLGLGLNWDQALFTLVANAKLSPISLISSTVYYQTQNRIL